MDYKVVIGGEVSLITRLDGDADLTVMLDGDASLTCMIDGEYGSTTIVEPHAHATYQGEYVVTPQHDTGITLDTNDKLMTEDVTVKKIPYYETTNVSNGYTVYIASEVD